MAHSRFEWEMGLVWEILVLGCGDLVVEYRLFEDILISVILEEIAGVEVRVIINLIFLDISDF